MNDDLIVTALHSLNTTVQANHIELVQRLTAVETRLESTYPIVARVEKLEGWKNTTAGFLIAANLMFGAAVTWFSRHGK